MSESIESKRKFLIASANADRFTLLKHLIPLHVGRTTFVSAEDGMQALHKVDNDPPNIVFVDQEIPRLAGAEVVRALLHRCKTPLAIVILGQIPETEDFVDQVALGSVQYLAPSELETKIGQVLARALNFLSQGDGLAFHLRFLASGDILIRQGEEAKSVFILKRGRLKAFAKGTEGAVLLGQIEPGEFVGEMAYINGEVRSADVIADLDCELIEIPVNHLDHLLFQKPAWSKALMMTLSKRVRKANDRLR